MLRFSSRRWSSSTKLHNKHGTEINPHRKNSNPMSNFNFVSMQQVNFCESNAFHCNWPQMFEKKDRKCICVCLLVLCHMCRLKSSRNSNILAQNQSKLNHGHLDNPNLTTTTNRRQPAVTVSHRHIQISVATATVHSVLMDVANSMLALTIKTPRHRYVSDVNTDYAFIPMNKFRFLWID